MMDEVRDEISDEVSDEIKNEAKGQTTMESDWNGEGAVAGAEPVPAYQLRVLSGRHSGAVMPLSPGRYSLGQNEDSDFIFLDDAFLGGQVMVDVTGAEPSIEVTGQLKAVLEGRELAAGQPAPLPQYVPVEVGATRFAVGPGHLPWPEPAAPKAESPETAPPEAGALPIAGEGGQPATEAEGNPEAKPAQRPARRVRLLLFLGLAFLAAAGGLTAWWLYPRAPVDTAGTLRAILAGMRLFDVKVEQKAEGFLLKGFIRTEGERDSLARRLAEFPVPVQVKLLSEEELRNALQGVLDLYNMSCTINMAPMGKAGVVCILENLGAGRELTESLRQSTPPEAILDVRLHPAAEAFSFLNRELSDKVLAHKIHPEMQQGRLACVLVKGQVDSLEMEDWKGIRESFRERFGVDLEERWTDKLSPVLQRFQNLARALDAQLVGVTVGEMSHITLKRRRKYFEGARIGGLTLKSIEKDRLVLSLDNVEQNYFLKKELK